ncbi:MAG: response regulator receiver domain [Microthrixaceae bacterium]
MTTHLERSKEAARRFLQSALIVDDRHVPPDDSAGEEAEELSDPSPFPADRVSESTPTSEAGPATETPTADAQAEDAGAIPIDPERLTESFASHGILCASLKPSPGDNMLALVVAAGTRCDIVILDWHIDSSDLSVTALPLLDALTAPTGPRLRLVAIYTGDPKLGEIEDAIVGLEGVQKDGLFRYTRRGSRIVLLSKPEAGTKLVPGAEVVDVGDLPDRLIEEFAANAAGLVPAATMSALGAVRENVNELLSVLEARLDAGFVGHRLALPSPDDATDHLAELIVSELASIISEDDQRRSCTDLQAVQSWLDDISDAAIVPPSTRDILMTLNVHGGEKDGMKALAESSFGSNTEAKKFLTADLTTRFMSKPDAIVADARFAHRMATVHAYGGGRPARVELGAIVRELATNIYFVCVLPLCDSVRLSGDVPAPFLPMKTVASKPFHVALVADEAPTFLRIVMKPSQIRMLVFPADGDLRCIISDETLRLRTSDGGEFEIVARLKSAQAQRLAHELGTAFSRVGLNESEWQRKRAQREDDPVLVCLECSKSLEEESTQ